MVDEFDNPLDDELLRELGLEPKSAPSTVSTQKAPPARDTVPKPPTMPLKPPVTPVAKKPPPPQVPPVVPKESAASGESPARFQEGIKNLAEETPVQVVAVLGKRSMTLKEACELKQGEVLELKKLPQESIDLVVNGKLMARGELVLVDGKLGIQIKQIV